MNERNYPEARPDADNAPLLSAWREKGELLLQTCRGCGKVVYYPRPICPHCWSDRLQWCPVDGRGRIVSFSLVHRPNQAAFFEETPIILAEVELDAGPLMLARVITADPEAVRTGLNVVLLKGEEARRYPLPTFRLETA